MAGLAIHALAPLAAKPKHGAEGVAQALAFLWLHDQSGLLHVGIARGAVEHHDALLQLVEPQNAVAGLELARVAA